MKFKEGDRLMYLGDDGTLLGTIYGLRGRRRRRSPHWAANIVMPRSH
jgi:hypothetical protein